MKNAKPLANPPTSAKMSGTATMSATMKSGTAGAGANASAAVATMSSAMGADLTANNPAAGVANAGGQFNVNDVIVLSRCVCVLVFVTQTRVFSEFATELVLRAISFRISTHILCSTISFLDRLCDFFLLSIAH